jgi:iron complex transport system substrate-binding protein
MKTLALVWFSATVLLAAATPKRIVSLSPSTTEILYGIGVFANVVAVSQFDTYPREVSRLPRVGGWQTTDVEKIVALHPDLVVLTKAQEPFIADKLTAFSVRFVGVPSDTLADVFAAIDVVGKATGRAKEAGDLIKKTRDSLDAVRVATRNVPHRSVLLVVNRTPGTLNDVYVATSGSFLIDLIDIAGGRSVAVPAKEGYGRLSKEAMLTLNPDIIIDLVHWKNAALSERVGEAWNDLPELRAVRQKHIYPVDDEFIPHPSQFVAHTAEVFLRILHPEMKR